MENIRNLSIIAHVDHGKSTLADRILEFTGAIEKRQMKEQILDRMDLERERGITIKMQPVSITYKKNNIPYTFNIIDTPGHIDFSYEVSRSLRAVEGVLLLIDSTQGVQAQTLSVLEMAQNLNLKIIPVLTKIDMQHSRVDEISLEVADLLNVSLDEVREVSGKTGDGVENLLDTIIEKIPAPSVDVNVDKNCALIFDFSYTNHTGINAFGRIFSGTFKKNDSVILLGAKQSFTLKDVGVFRPDMESKNFISAGAIGYFTTGIKEPGVAVVGDTLTYTQNKGNVFPGYEEVNSVIWASLYPQNADEYRQLEHTLKEMRLSDAAFTYEEEQSTVLGKGFRCGFLGMLHLEIITERIRREALIELIITAPTTDYKIKLKNGKEVLCATPSQFPETQDIVSITEPWVAIDIIIPTNLIASVSALFIDYEGSIIKVEDFKNDRCILKGEMPLRELMRNFFDKLKSSTSGYASLSYKRIDNRPSQVTRLDILLAEEPFPAFASIVSKNRGEREGRKLVEILHNTIPRTLFVIKIQAKMDNRIVASKTLPALRKDVTAKLYGGDITRKMKLREKQKKGKKKMNEHGRVTVAHDVFLKVIRKKNS